MFRYFYFNFMVKLVSFNEKRFNFFLVLLFMSNSGKIPMLKAVLFIPFIITVLFAFYKIKKVRIERKRSAVNKYIGEKFPRLPLVDSTGNTFTFDLSKSGITIIDFWYKSCPQCIAEMKQFEEVLKGRQEKVSIISISIDQYDDWKTLLSGKDQRFSFLGNAVSNWLHLLLKFDTDSAKLNNAEYLSAKLGVAGFPSFYVLNKEGVIIATPTSAVSYIKTEVGGQYNFILFLKSAATWKQYYLYFILLISSLVYLSFFKFLRIPFLIKTKV